MKLCRFCSDVLSPFAEALVTQIMVPEFVARWNYIDCYRDIIAGFASLIDKVSEQDLQRCTALLPMVAKPLLVPLNDAI